MGVASVLLPSILRGSLSHTCPRINGWKEVDGPQLSLMLYMERARDFYGPHAVDSLKGLVEQNHMVLFSQKINMISLVLCSSFK